MAEIVKINSKKGLVTLSKEDISTYELAPWLRTNSKGIGHYSFINQQPFERAAAKLFVEKYPSDHVKVAENISCRPDGTIDVYLRITESSAKGYYNTHPTKLVFNKGKSVVVDLKDKEGSFEDDFRKIADDMGEEVEIFEADNEESDNSEKIEELLEELEKIPMEEFPANIIEELKEFVDNIDSTEGKLEEMTIGKDSEKELESCGENCECEKHEDGIESICEVENKSDDLFKDDSEEGNILKTVDLEDFSDEEPVIIKIDELGNPDKMDDFVGKNFKDEKEFGPDKIKDIIKTIVGR